MHIYPGSAHIIRKHIIETRKEASPYWTIESSIYDSSLIHVVLQYAPTRDYVKPIRINIQLSDNYPLIAPSIIVLDKVDHPCINQESGKFDLYSHPDDWSPAMSLQKTLLYICSELYIYDPILAAAAQKTQRFKMELLERTMYPVEIQ